VNTRSRGNRCAGAVSLRNYPAIMIALPDIALATASDAQPIALLSRDEVEQGLRWAWTPGRVRRAIEDKETNVVVARHGTSVVGFALMKYLDDEAHLLLLAVHRNHRRKGVATALMAWLDGTLRTAGIATIQVEVRVANGVAQAFYARLGYRPVKAMPRYYQGVEDALMLVKELRPGDG
jgi:ribosomal-protein-alanine N-acetyltransferase